MPERTARLKTRVKTAKRRSSSSTRWLDRQLNDPYVEQAKRDGYRARSVYKLKEIDERFKLCRPGGTIVDLGSAPGSWSQYSAQNGCRVIAVDLLMMEPIPGVAFLQGDFLDPDIDSRLLPMVGGPIDTVLSDIAADATGRKVVDRLKAEAVGEAVLAFAAQHLRKGGDCLLKIVRGAEVPLRNLAKQHATQVHLIKPRATRSDSSEIYMLARDFAGPTGDPEASR